MKETRRGTVSMGPVGGRKEGVPVLPGSVPTLLTSGLVPGFGKDFE